VKLLKFDSLDGMKRLNFINVLQASFERLTLISTMLFIIPLLLISCKDKTLKTGYIDINLINQEYKLAKEYEKHIKSIENTYAADLLGIQADLNILKDSIDIILDRNVKPSQELLAEYYQKKIEYQKYESEILENVQDSVKYYREKLNNKINELVFEFAQHKRYDYVFSPAGSGAFMYGDSSLNITQEVLVYLNSK